MSGHVYKMQNTALLLASVCRLMLAAPALAARLVTACNFALGAA